MEKKESEQKVKPQYTPMCGDKKRRCCSSNPDCYTKIKVLPDGTISKPGTCCNY